VFDLTRLRGVDSEQVWTEDARYPLVSAVHNLAINEDSGFAYLVGGNAGIVVPDQCNSGLHMIDINDPKSPTFAGCFADDGYTHDTQCVMYEGPDEAHHGKEICVSSNEDHVAVVDVTDKANPQRLGEVRYEQTAYTHQGWFTEDQAYFLVGDELDEQDHRIPTRTLILDLTDLDNPSLVGEHLHDTPSIDHNMYTLDGLVYQSNYTAGLRVLDTVDVADGTLTEVAYFDTYPENDDAVFNGTWSNYPYFDSGTIAVSGIDEGLFLLRLQDHVASEGRNGGDEVDAEDPSERRGPPAHRPRPRT
jgi:choice-of-anchor B domain-containing protein